MSIENAYDGDIGTYAVAGTLNFYMELTIAATRCSKVRIWASNSIGEAVSNGKIEVYYNGAYHTLHNGLIAALQWVEYEIGSTEIVTGCKLTITDSMTFRCFEFAFWEEIKTPADGYGSLKAARLFQRM